MIASLVDVVDVLRNMQLSIFIVSGMLSAYLCKRQICCRLNGKHNFNSSEELAVEVTCDVKIPFYVPFGLAISTVGYGPSVTRIFSMFFFLFFSNFLNSFESARACTHVYGWTFNE